MKMGYCNCFADKEHHGHIYLGAKFLPVRVDKDGLCYLCANIAMNAPLPPPMRSNNKYWDNRADATISADNPDGIFNPEIRKIK